VFETIEHDGTPSCAKKIINFVTPRITRSNQISFADSKLFAVYYPDDDTSRRVVNINKGDFVGVERGCITVINTDQLVWYFRIPEINATDESFCQEL
jgi:hypothetical protein